MTPRNRKGIFLALGTAAAMTLAACSGGGAEPSTDDGAGGGGGNSGYTIAMITHETPGDAFWDKIKAGAEQAATDVGATLKYSNDPDATKQAVLIQNAVDSDVDGIATTMATPDSLKTAMGNAANADIPLVAFNSGINEYADAGASMYFGSDETLAGETAGERITAEGGQHTLCVIQQTGSVALEARCAGVKAKMPNTENIQVNGANDADVVATLNAKLATDPSIDYVVTLGAAQALDTIKAKASSGSTAKIITFDLSADVAQSIKDGEVEFSIDQQPYVQGYMAVTSLYLNIKNGNDIGGGQATLTGPSIVDAENIDVILPFAQNNTR